VKDDDDDEDDDEIPLFLRILIQLRSYVISSWENGRPCYTPTWAVIFSMAPK